MKYLMGLFLTAGRIDRAAVAFTAYNDRMNNYCTVHGTSWFGIQVYQLTSVSWAQTNGSCKHKYTTFHCDANSLEMDWYFIMGVYFFFGAGKIYISICTYFFLA